MNWNSRRKIRKCIYFLLFPAEFFWSLLFSNCGLNGSGYSPPLDLRDNPDGARLCMAGSRFLRKRFYFQARLRGHKMHSDGELQLVIRKQFFFSPLHYIVEIFIILWIQFCSFLKKNHQTKKTQKIR